jgi:putative hemolysin
MEIIVIFFLIILNAFFAMSEMAIVASNKNNLKNLANKGDLRAKAAFKLADDPSRFLSTVQVGITVIGIIAGAYGGAEIAEDIKPFISEIKILEPYSNIFSIGIVVSCITFFSVVMGELVPKQIALSNPEKIALWIARPMEFISRIFAPVVFALGNSAKLLLKLIGIKRRKIEITDNEIKSMINEALEVGSIEHKEHEMLQRILHLGDRSVRSIMTPKHDVVFFEVNDDIEVIREKIKQYNHSNYPVFDEKESRIIGFVRTKDLVKQPKTDLCNNFLSNHVKQIHTVSENSKCFDLIDSFKNKHISIASVIDNNGEMSGIITASDILESIIGIMPSNYYSSEDTMIVKRKDGSWLVDGSTPIEEILIVIGIDQIETVYNSIAGFILQHLKRTPKTGETFTYHGFNFEIIDMDGIRIDKVLISKM